MAEEPTPPGSVPGAVIDQCEGLSADQLRALAAYLETLATHRERAEAARDDDASPDADPAERPDGVPAGASVTVKEINDNRYRYWQWRDGEQIKSKYIGPATQSE